MAITKERKVEIMNDLVQKFKSAKSIGFATTNTLTVEEFANLRKNLREVDASYTLAKKTIIKMALKEALNIELDLNDLPGQIGVVCSNDDPMSGLGKLNSFMKEANGPKGDKGRALWAISIFEGELKNNEETKVLASMPSRDTLLSRLVGSMKAPISALARFFDAASKELEKTGKNSVGELDGKSTPEIEVSNEETKINEEVKEEVSEKTEESTKNDQITKEENTGNEIQVEEKKDDNEEIIETKDLKEDSKEEEKNEIANEENIEEKKKEND